MGLFSGLFGPSREEIWQQVAASLNGQYLPGGFLRGDRVQVRTDNGIITLDLESRSAGESSTTYTRLRAPFVNRLGQRLRIYRTGFFSELGKMMGTQDIEVGEPGFDADFMVQGRSPEWVRAVLDPAAQRLIRPHERFFLEVRPEQRWFSSNYPEGVELLLFEVPVILKDAEQLRALFQLLDHLLRRMETVGLSHLDPNARLIAILEGPGGQIVERDDLLWNGTEPRYHAAAELGRLKEQRAVPALIAALRDADPGLHQIAAVSLGQIGAPAALPALIPLLGREPRLPEGSLAGRAAQSIGMLGESSLVDNFRAACAGRLESPEAVDRYRPSFVQALIAVLASSDPTMLAGSAASLAQLGAVEALEALRERHRRMDRNQAQTREALDGAIRQLESASRLPRPASSPGVNSAALPRPAEPGRLGETQSLPLPSGHPDPTPRKAG